MRNAHVVARLATIVVARDWLMNTRLGRSGQNLVATRDHCRDSRQARSRLASSVAARDRPLWFA